MLIPKSKNPFVSPTLRLSLVLELNFNIKKK